MLIWHNLLERMINEKNYTSKEDMLNKINTFAEKGRIDSTEKANLTELLNTVA